MNVIPALLRQWKSTGLAAGGEKRSRRAVLAGFVLACVLTMTPGLFWSARADDQRNVVIITSTDSSYQNQTAARIKANLDSNNIPTAIISAEGLLNLLDNSSTVYVAIGENAINTLRELDPNAIVLRLNNRKIPGTTYTSTQSDLITEQSPCRHLQLIRAINPKWTTIGVLSSINAADTTANLTRCAIRLNMNLQLYAITDESDLQKTLKTAVEYNKVLLAIVDPLVYNSRTVKNILLTSYRHRKPVIGYSESFVQAGAVAAIFTSPETAGNDAAEIIINFFDNNWQFKKNTYTPSEFSVSTNKQVATSLEIKLPEVDTILNRIRDMDAKR